MKIILAVAGVVIKEMYRRKELYVLLTLTAVITLLMGSINFFDDDRIIRILRATCLLLIWISSLIIAIGTTARQIASEKEQRTIFPLLAKPVSRPQFLAGKFLGCWLACGIALLCFYLFFGCFNAAREHQWRLLSYFQAATLHWAMLGMLIGLVLVGSLMFTAPSSNATICGVVAVGILVVGRYLHRVAQTLSEPAHTALSSLYYAIPHLEIFDVRLRLIHNWPPLDWTTYGVALLYATLYSVLLWVVACLLFRRRALN